MKVISVIMAAACAATAFGQTNTFLTWEACLAQTKAHNPDMVSARAAVRELEYGVAAATSGFLPQISARAGVSTGQNENQNNWTSRENSSGSLSLQQDLFSGGGNIASRRRGLAQLRVGHEQYRKTLSDVELRTRLAYINVLYAQDLVELTQRIAERRANNTRLIQLRFDGGRENKGSLARSKAQLSQARYEVREAERSLRFALRNLAAAMGGDRPPSGAAGDLAATAPDILSNLDGLMMQTPDFLIATTQIEASRQGMKVTRSARFPQITFNAGASIGDPSGFERYDASWNVGLNASMPIYTGNRLNSQVAAAREQIVQSEMELLDTSNTLLATLLERWNLYTDSVENEAVQKELYDAEFLRAEISSAKYKQGLLSYEDWDIIESNLINQGKTHLQRRRAAEIEQARWKNALGWSVWNVEQGE